MSTDPAVADWEAATTAPDPDLKVSEDARAKLAATLAWWEANWAAQPDAAHRVLEDIFEQTTARRPGAPDRARVGPDESVWCDLGPLMGGGTSNVDLRMAALRRCHDGPLTWDEQLTSHWAGVLVAEPCDLRNALIALATTAVLWAETLPHEGRRAGR